MHDTEMLGRRLSRDRGAATGILMGMPAAFGEYEGRRAQEGGGLGGVATAQPGPSSAIIDGAGKGAGTVAVHAPGRPVGDKKKQLKTALLPGVKASSTVLARLPGGGSGLRARPSKREVAWTAVRAALRRRALRLPRFALRSELTGGFVNVDTPPAPNALFAHSVGDATKEPLSLSSAFALPRSSVGVIFAFGSDALLSLCETAAHEDWVACTATPVLLRAPKAVHPSKASAHHRKFLVSADNQPTAHFVVEVLGK
jgi:hypothetical protein